MKAVTPTTVEELIQLAKFYYKLPYIRKTYTNIEEVVYCMNLALSVGMSIEQGLQNIYIKNGKPCVWGDMLLGIASASGLMADFSEHYEEDGEIVQIIKGKTNLSDTFTAVCTTIRQDTNRRTADVTKRAKAVSSFSVHDAKTAGLWLHGTLDLSKADDRRKTKLPWHAYAARMLMMRARTFLLRDAYADALKGLISVEEATDYNIDLPTNVTQSPKTIEEPKAELAKMIEEPKAIIDKPTPDESLIRRSEMHDEAYIIDTLGWIHFESGVIYNNDEILTLKNLNLEEKKQLHEFKKDALDFPITKDTNLFTSTYHVKLGL